MTEDLKSGLPVVRASRLQVQGSNRLASLPPNGGSEDEILNFPS